MSKRNKINQIKNRERLKRGRQKWLAAFLIPLIPSIMVNIDWPSLKKERQNHKRNLNDEIGYYNNDVYPLPPNDQSVEITIIQGLGHVIQGFYHLMEVLIIAGVALAIFYLLFQYLKSR